MRKIHSVAVPAAAALAVAALAGPAYGGAFELRTFEAKGGAMSNAFTAVADTPAANSYNPAGMSQLDGMQGSATLQLIAPYIHFEAEDDAEGEANAERRRSSVPSTFASFEATDFLHLGLGITVPFGTNVGWEDDWPGRYISTLTRIETIEVNPNFSIKYPFGGHMIAFGAGFSYVRTSVRLEQAVSQSSGSDAYAQLFGDTDDRPNWAWDVGVLLSLFDRKVRVGAMYRSSVEDVNVHGTAEFYNQGINPLTGQLLLPLSTRVKTKLTYPDRAKFGVAFMPIEPLTIAADFAWTNWSRLESVVLRFPQLNRVSVIPLAFHDSYFVSLGGEYKILPDLLSARVGTFWDQTPFQKRTRSPAIPDNTRYGFSLGAGVTPVPALSLDFAYTYVILREMEKDNEIGSTNVPGGSPRANGTFNTNAHVLALTVGLKF
jgi:long-chain fatty acid transport protein